MLVTTPKGPYGPVGGYRRVPGSLAYVRPYIER